MDRSDRKLMLPVSPGLSLLSLQPMRRRRFCARGAAEATGRRQGKGRRGGGTGWDSVRFGDRPHPDHLSLAKPRTSNHHHHHHHHQPVPSPSSYSTSPPSRIDTHSCRATITPPILTCTPSPRSINQSTRRSDFFLAPTSISSLSPLSLTTLSPIATFFPCDISCDAPSTLQEHL